MDQTGQKVFRVHFDFVQNSKSLHKRALITLRAGTVGIPALRSKSIPIPALPVPALPQTPPPEIPAFPPFHAIPALHLGLNPVPALSVPAFLGGAEETMI